MQADDVGTLLALNKVRADLFDPVITAHGGRMVKTMGDGFLIEFASVVEACACALDIQTGLADRAQDDAPCFRIGINLGDVLVENGDIFGDGVNLAARVEEIAPPGGVAITGRVHREVEGRVEAVFTDGGVRRFKNIAQSVQIWTWTPGRGQSVARGKKAPNSTNRWLPVLLITPFDAAGEPAARELADELFVELLSALSKHSGMSVVVDTGGSVRPTYELHLRCRVSGQQCRVQAYLVKPATGERFWSERFDRKTSNPFGFADRVVTRISAAIRVHIAAYGGEHLADIPDAKLSVPDLLAKAAYYYWRLTVEATRIGRATVQHALSLEPDHPTALAMLAHSYIHMTPMQFEDMTQEQKEEMFSIADRAVALNQKTEFVLRTRGALRLWLFGDHEGARADCDRALEINPNSHLPHLNTGVSEIMNGLHDQGVARLGGIIRNLPNEPQKPYMQSMMALGHLLAGRPEGAIATAREGYEQAPNSAWHALVYAVAAADDVAIVGSEPFKKVLATIDLPADHFGQLPFSDPQEVAWLIDRARRVGVR